MYTPLSPCSSRQTDNSIGFSDNQVRGTAGGQEMLEMLRLEFERRQARITQAALGRETGVNPSTVSQIESGRVRASVSELRRIADALGYGDDPAKLSEEVSRP